MQYAHQSSFEWCMSRLMLKYGDWKVLLVSSIKQFTANLCMSFQASWYIQVV